MTSSLTCESTLYFIKKDSRTIIAIKTCDFAKGGRQGSTTYWWMTKGVGWKLHACVLMCVQMQEKTLIGERGREGSS
jgi:hypothetical protein